MQNFDRLASNAFRRLLEVVLSLGNFLNEGTAAGGAKGFSMESLAKIPTEVEFASEFRYRNPIVEDGTVLIAISQSGETADTLAALEEAHVELRMAARN